MCMTMPSDAVVDAIVRRAEERYQDQRQDVLRATDRLFAALMAGQWVFGIVIALTFSPYGWEGKAKVVHVHVWVATLLGAALSSLPIALALLRPGWVVTRHVVAAAQMLWSALLIHLTGGRIESHFHVFGSLGILAGYRDWPVLLTATVVVAADHLIRGLVWPESVYGIVNPEWWRFLEHAFWVVFAASFLVLLCRRSIREMRLIADRGAELEALSEGEWRKSSVLERVQTEVAAPRAAAS
jgi:two-component system, NtrC family, sensor histidine kinase HydH